MKLKSQALRSRFGLLFLIVFGIIGVPWLFIATGIININLMNMICMFGGQVAGLIVCIRALTYRILTNVDSVQGALSALAAGTLVNNIEVLRNDEFAGIKHSINNMRERVESAASFATSIGNGQLDVQYNEQFRDDALAQSLQVMHQKLKASDEENKRRNWVNSGLASFSQLVRSNDADITELSRKLISTLVKYVGANQGQLYVVSPDADDRYLELAATYAWEKTKHLTVRINEGEGLMGQVWLEKSTMYLKEIPKNYIKITSGLGQALPGRLLIVPVKINEEVFGMVELASFHDIADHQITFVEKVGELIASMVSSARINSQTRKLLEESQTQTEQLRAQEEEMRQNMEELTATQEEMHRKDMEISGQLNAINNSMATIEFTLDGIVVTANEKFTQTTGYSLEEIRGKHHRMFVHSDYTDTSEYRQFWKALNEGKAQTGEFIRKHKTGRDIWISASYTVVTDGNGKPMKVIKFALDITDQKLRALDFEGQVNAVNNTMASIEFKLDGQIVCANQKFLDAVGYTREEIVGNYHKMFLDDATATSEAYHTFWANLRDGKAQTGEFKRFGKGNREIWISASYTPIRDAKGTISKVVKFAQEITQQKHQAVDYAGQIRAIRRSNAVIEFDLDGRILFANDLFLEAMGYSSENEVVGKHHSIFVPSLEADSIDYRNFWNRLRNSEFFTGEFRRRKKNGEDIWIYGSYNPITNGEGKTYKVVKYAHVVNKQPVDSPVPVAVFAT